MAKAFLLGVGLPALLQAGVIGATSKQANTEKPPPQAHTKNTAASDGFSLFSTAAYAQELPQAKSHVEQSKTPDGEAPLTSNGTRSQTLIRNLKFDLGALPAADAQLIYSFQDGKTQVVPMINVLAQQREEGKVSAPPFATGLSIWAPSQGLRSTEYKLSKKEGGTTHISVELTNNFWGGFLQTLGVQNAHPVDISLKAAKTPSGEQP
jgi:hypothetical protein